MRGDVFGLRAPKDARGHEQRNRRYAVVVQATRFAHLSTWLVAPTSTSAGDAIFRPTIDIPGLSETRVLCDAATSIDPQLRLTELLGSVSWREMTEIDAALRLLMDLDDV